MNVCPVMPASARVREGVLSSDGLGRLRLPKPRSPKSAFRHLRKVAPLNPLARHRRHGRRRGKLLRGLVHPGVVPTLGSWGASRQAAMYDQGLGDLGKLSFKKLGRGLKKVVKSKAFRYAAIGAAAYFTGGAALTALKAGKGGGLFSGLFGKGTRGILSSAVKAYGSTRMAPTIPGSIDAGNQYGYGYGQGTGYGGSYGGGGGSYGMPSFDASSYGAGGGSEGGQDQGRTAGFGGGDLGNIVPWAIGGTVLVALLSQRGR